MAGESRVQARMTAAPTTKPKPKHPKFRKMWDEVEVRPEPKRATFKKMWDQAGEVSKPETTFQRMWRGKAPTPEPKPAAPRRGALARAVSQPTMAPAEVEYPVKREAEVAPKPPTPAEHMQRMGISKVKPGTFGEPPAEAPVPVDTRLVLQVANQVAADAGVKGKWARATKEERERGIMSEWQAEQVFKIPPAEDLADYVTDLAAGIMTYVAELVVAKKVMARTGLPKSVQTAGAWEAVSQAKGEPLGSGAARGLVFYSIAQAPLKIGLKTLAQSGALAGITKAQGGDWADALVSAAIPWVFRGIDITSNSLMGRAMQVRTPRQRAKFKDFLWRRAKTIKGKIYAPGERAKEIRLRRRAVTEPRPEARVRERALALPPPARPAPAAVPPIAPKPAPAAPAPPVAEKPAAKVPPGPERGVATRKLRQQIRAVVAKRGIPQSEWRKLALEHGGERQLRNLTLEGLERVYAAVQKARPKKIGFKAVVTPKTEKKIQTLKARLLQSQQTTPEDFTRQMQELRIKQPGYVDAKHFITETDAKELIHKMLDEAPAIREREATKRAFKKPEQKGVATHAEGIDKEVGKARAKREARGKLAKAGALSSMRHYTVNLQEQTGLPFHDLWEGMNRTHLRIRADIEKMHGRLQGASPEYKAIAKDPEAGRRISDYIESQLPDGPKVPKDIAPEEVKVAREVQKIADEFKNDVRYARFMDHYYQKAEIRDAPQSELTKATDIYEGQGPEALREYLDHRPWGVIKRGYTPRELLVGRIQLRKPSAIAFGKGHIKVRTAGQQAQDRTIFQRLDSYMRQIWNITRLEPKARALIRLHDENVSKFAKPRAIREGLELAINESKGYPQPGGPINRILRRVSGQAMRAVFFRPVMSLRNLFQNPAFNEDFSFGAFIDPRNKTLTDADWAYFNSEVDQTGPMRRQFLMQEERPFPPFRFISKIADKLAHYPLADKTNRLGAFWARINRVRRALAGKDLSEPKAVKEMMDKAGFASLELTQQHRALEALARYGPDVMARYVAAEHTLNVHFPYERAQRSPAEMGATGRTLASLLAFPRGWGERIYREMRKVGRGGTYTARRRALGRVIHMTLVAGVWGVAFMKLTGRMKNPYNPFNILNWTPGGLVIGASAEVSKTMYLITNAARGDQMALNKLPAQITRMGNLYLVGYEMAADLVDVLLKSKGADRHLLRKIRAMLDKQYKPRAEHYQAERTLIQDIQKAVLGVEAEEKKAPRRRRVGR